MRKNHWSSPFGGGQGRSAREIEHLADTLLWTGGLLVVAMIAFVLAYFL